MSQEWGDGKSLGMGDPKIGKATKVRDNRHGVLPALTSPTLCPLGPAQTAHTHIHTRLWSTRLLLPSPSLCLVSVSQGRWIVSLAGAEGGGSTTQGFWCILFLPALDPLHHLPRTVLTIILIYWTMIFRVPYRPPESDLVAVMALNTMSLWSHRATFLWKRESDFRGVKLPVGLLVAAA